MGQQRSVAGTGQRARWRRSPAGAVAVTGRGALEAVGVRADDEALYRTLIAHPGVTVDVLARHHQASVAGLRRALHRLEDLGLVGRVPGTPRRYVPAPPDTAIAALLHAHERGLERVAITAAELTDCYAAAAGGIPGEPVEMVHGRRAVVRRFLQLQKGARQELLVFDQPPYATARNPIEARALRRGVRYRAIYTLAALELPDGLDHVRRLVAAGEEARVLADLPTKLVVADRAVALVPLTGERDRLADGAAVVRAPTLVATLVLVFSLLWERAAPIPASPGEARCDRGDPAELDATDERVLVLLTAGLKDEAIARQLGASDRTVRRRVRRLMSVLGARTRFQAGLQAARRGWV